jgi:hypothetical protein
MRSTKRGGCVDEARCVMQSVRREELGGPPAPQEIRRYLGTGPYQFIALLTGRWAANR